MTGAPLLSRFGLRPARPSSATNSARVGQFYFGDQAGKWVSFKSALTVKSPTSPGQLKSAPTEAFLEQSATLVKARFDGQPSMQAELYAVVGQSFADMGAFRLASEYGLKRVAALDMAHANRTDRARALLKLARHLLEDRQLVGAEVHAQRAMALSEGDVSIVVPAQAVIARALFLAGKLDLAATLLDQIEARAATLPDEGGVTAARTMVTRANWLSRKNRRVESMRMYAAAIAKALSIEGPDSVVASEARLDVAFELASTRDAAGAARYFDAGIEVLRRRGHDHAIGAALTTARFAANRFQQAWQIPFAEAHAAISNARSEIAASGRTIPSEMSMDLDFIEGSVLSRWGMIETARPLLARSVDALYKAASTPGRRFRLSMTFARQLMSEGSHEPADHWFKEGLRARVDMGAAQHPFAAGDYRGIANNLRMWGRFEQAEAALAQAPNFPAITLERDVNPDRYNLFLRLLGSEIALDNGRTTEAIANFPHGLINPPGAVPRDDFDAQFVLGRALCTNAHAPEGLAHLREFLIREGPDTYEHDPQLAYRRAVAGLCALQTGDRQAAQAWGRQARESFTVQPGVRLLQGTTARTRSEARKALIEPIIAPDRS